MKLSQNFTREEFDCHDGSLVPPELMANLQDLVDGVLQPVRDRSGPLAIISGYRTPRYNSRIDGALKSNHMTASAADVRPSSMTVTELHSLILDMHKAGRLPVLGGLGLYPSWVHVDTLKAPDGHLRRWAGGKIGEEK